MSDDLTSMPCQIVVFCDECGVEHTADYWVHEEDSQAKRLGVARAHMRTNERWSCDERGDFCPEHAPVASLEMGDPDE
jgi:hypothetical protein